MVVIRVIQRVSRRVFSLPCMLPLAGDTRARHGPSTTMVVPQQGLILGLVVVVVEDIFVLLELLLLGASVLVGAPVPGVVFDIHDHRRAMSSSLVVSFPAPFPVTIALALAFMVWATAAG